jgi:hypothetical protein
MTPASSIPDKLYNDRERILEQLQADSQAETEHDTLYPLDCAVTLDSIPKVKILLAYDMDINVRSPLSCTALHHTTLCDYIRPILQFFIENGAKFQVADNKVEL